MPADDIDRTDIDAPVRRGPIRWLILCGVVLIAAISIGTAVMVSNFQERALANSERELENTVLLLTRHFDQQLEQLDLVQKQLAEDINLAGITSGDGYERKMSGQDMHLMLKAKIGALAYISTVSLIGSDGKLINFTRLWPVTSVTDVDRDYFEAFKSDPQVTTVLNDPVKSRISGAWTIKLARKLSAPNGEFLGLIVGTIELPEFESFFASVALGEGAAIAMFHRDGTLLARHPHVESMIGRNFITGPLFQNLVLKATRGTTRLESRIDGLDRLVSARALSHFPIVVIAATTVSAALVDWREQTKLLIGVAGLLVLAIAVILFLIVRQLSRQHQLSERRLSMEKQRLRTAINNMTQGLLLFDSSHRIVICNQRYIEMYGLSHDVVKPGCSLRDVIRHREQSGSFCGDVDEYCSIISREIEQGKVTQLVIKTPAGRSIHIRSKPTANGGWVSTHEDVTEQAEAERILQESEKRFSGLFEHSPDGLMLCNNRGEIELVNTEATKIFGYSSDELVGQSVEVLIPKGARERHIAHRDRYSQAPTRRLMSEARVDIRGLRKDGSTFSADISMSPIDAAGEGMLCITVRDITERRRSEERITYLAHYDALTDLPNRVLFREQIEQQLKRINRGNQFALLYIDIDEFKGINESLGHHVGDELLKAVASRLRGCVRDTDFVARLGGDEFAIVQTAVEHPTDVTELVTRIYQAIREPYECLGHRISTDASIGIALAPGDSTDLDQLLKNADIAMYSAKADGRRTYRFFEPAMDASVKARRALEQDLRQAIADGGFEIHYQPLVDLNTDKVTGCEALLRWRHPERGMISPAEFIPVAEDTGLIIELGDWVLRTACAEAATWPDQVRLAVNVSPVQLKCQTLALKIMSALAASGLPAHRLELEITEAVLIRDDEAALAILYQLRAIGVRIALDDFGTGYSSLSYLKRFPFDKIKIDRCFVSDIAEIDGSSTIVQAVVNIAAARNMTTTAEGVETQRQKELLRALGCTQMQGYLFSAAKPGPEVRRLFGSRHESVAAVA
ncbi:MAG: EAL domain-containing protein [Bradyrhizobiaceae bacterium]|nr:MAG: EAL domain-containing protein [Bradyrhizobiaceae bacterium]